jgi:hypothetical protein
VLTALGYKVPAGAVTVTTAQQLAAIAGHDPTNEQKSRRRFDCQGCPRSHGSRNRNHQT